ncbi:MAG: hypothetical protein F6K37_40630 [Moorea sp. SIO4E2]|uniref:hypothetical protein n=1 Tax=Moorena sp. SIO4E2 TaxID=2607826 RepID=UPI0013B863E8|nr:hypothetical protein [Moorena sp. SIO4E2]NEQ11945.1 hypothetical protein [Moorena sp. SIO4E2]
MRSLFRNMRSLPATVAVEHTDYPDYPGLPIGEIEGFLAEVDTKDYLQLVAEFRNWVRKG